MTSTPIHRPPSNLVHATSASRLTNGVVSNTTAARRGMSATRDVPNGAGLGAAAAEEEREEDPLHTALRQRCHRAEADIAALFSDNGGEAQGRGRKRSAQEMEGDHPAGPSQSDIAKTEPPRKKAARTIDEDDYGDDDDEEEDEIEHTSPLKSKGKGSLPNGTSAAATRSPAPAPSQKLAPVRTETSSSSDQGKSSEDVRKQLEEDKKAAAEGAKRSFQAMFYTFESDHDAMVEQQKLDELDREVENEISGSHDASSTAQAGPSNSTAPAQGSLGSTDLGASSLTLKHLIARIDAKRDQVRASDNQLRTLISEVRKGRSKWASEERVGQEELYEAAEKVLMELKAMTEYAQPFLTRVNKRDAIDYYQIIKNPMDLGTMIKKLKQLAYKSKKEFVDDLGLIWNNCLKYNSAPEHPFRKKALYMRKETDKLTPLIPDIVVRDRAEVEAEERRLQSMDAGDDSEDDELPIMASRGRKAPKKGVKGGSSNTTRKAPSVEVDGTPMPEARPALHASTTNLRNESLRADSEMHDVSSAGFNTPPPGTATPLVNGVHNSGAPGSQADVMEVDGLGNSIVSNAPEEEDEDDAEFKTWKQVTKKDRAQAAAERNRLFRGEQLNPDEPAILRTKALMRRWQRQQKAFSSEQGAQDLDMLEDEEGKGNSASGETLAEGIEKDEDSTLPDYYHPLSAIPDIRNGLQWITDSEGDVVPQSDEHMRIYPKGHFVSPDGGLSRKIEANMAQMQDTRKICTKIGVVKQMQIQAQTYQNQFQKYEPEPFAEKDVGPVVVSEDGPIMAPWVCRQAFQRTIGKVFYHAGFEDFQPSALDAVTDLAGEYFGKLTHTLKTYMEQPKLDAETPRFSREEQVLHTLHESGLDLEALETYVKDDVERFGTKLGVVHDRMKSHLTDLLRPALGENAGADGAGAFNDGSDQFASGDFAEDFDEDYFGLKELGIADELGLATLSVPFHLLQNRVNSAYNSQNVGPVAATGPVFPPPEPYDPITTENVGNQIGLVQDFFRSKLRQNHEEPLVEDEDLPQKQRFPKPRLPPTGKISSPRKRPIREQQQAAKKKRKLEEGGGSVEAGRRNELLQQPIGKLNLQAPSEQTTEEPQKAESGGGGGAMPSPESI
ncbi:hypothetical protein MBLNU230_g3627t1 [Neophaeotheca triangularis]